MSNYKNIPAAKCQSLVELLRYRASETPDKVAYTFLTDGQGSTQIFSYAELDYQARKIACLLQSYKLTGERALLLYPAGLEVITAFFGCLYAGVIAIPLPAPNPSRLNRTLPRIQSVSDDSQPQVVLTTASLLAAIETGFEYAPELQKIRWLATDNLPDEALTDWKQPPLAGSYLAYLQYTSGSTSKPKGVMVSHENIISNCEYARQVWDYQPDSISVHWMPYFHDYGLMDGIIAPLYNGIMVSLMSPLDFLKNPLFWLQTISRFKATHSAGPNFSYDLCVQRFSPEKCLGLDLSSWRMAANAAEPIRKDTLDKFAKTYAPYGFHKDNFYPSYGLAEATLVVSARPSPTFCQVSISAYEQNLIVETNIEQRDSRTIVGCGQVLLDMKVAIVDPKKLTKCAPNEVGEVWISHSCVTQGYWQHPEETKQTFQAYLADTGEGPFLRTGDLGFLKGNELFITGRYKDLIIINGRNYYPQDIEFSVEKSHPTIRLGCTAAFALDFNGEEHVAIVAEVERRSKERLATYTGKDKSTRQGDVEIDAFSNELYLSLDTTKVFMAIREKIAEDHGLPIYGIALIKPGTIFKTSSGKIQRQACRKAFLQNSLNGEAIWRIDDDLAHPTSIQVQPVRSAPEQRSAQEQVSSTLARDIISWLREYAEERINSRLIDERRTIPPYIVLDFGNKGILGMQVPKEYGGLSLTYHHTLRIVEQLAAIDISLGTFVLINNILGIRPIQHYGSKDLQDSLLPQLAKGRQLAAFAITEPNAGSNPRAITTLATHKPNGMWSLRGTKIWSSSASSAGVINVFTKYTDSQNISGFAGFAVSTNSKGLRFGPESLTMGMRGIVQTSVLLEDTLVPESHLLGELGAGMDIANDAMLITRLGLGAVSVGGMKRCVQLMLRYAHRRPISTGILLDNPVSLSRLTNLTAAITTIETFIHKVADILDKGRFVPVEAYIVCKTTGPEMLWQATDQMIQMLGGRGYVDPNMAPQMLRDARILRIFEGPTETLNMFLGTLIYNNSASADKFLCQELNAPTIAQTLHSTAQEIVECCLKNSTNFAQPGAALHLAHTLIGEVSSWGFLLAAIEDLAKQSNNKNVKVAAQWAKLHFEKIKQSALRTVQYEMPLSKDTLLEFINDYTYTIGDVEQTLAGEDYQCDELLGRSTNIKPSNINKAVRTNALTMLPSLALEFRRTKDFTALPFPEDPQTKNLATQLGQTNSGLDINYKDENAITRWLEEWIAKKTKIAVQTIDIDKPFIYYGLDSVTGVMMAQDLEQWLATSLSPTIAWDYPNIRSMARYAVSKFLKTTSLTSEEANITIAQKEDLEDLFTQLDKMSENEAAELLSIKQNEGESTA